ncbi:hypothetical protein AA313_de0205167 [Arthrobotrys entomopaga]|nr:hypothetical protein AA313_de0205167 [Arthrobotrys entomopaga]
MFSILRSMRAAFSAQKSYFSFPGLHITRFQSSKTTKNMVVRIAKMIPSSPATPMREPTVSIINHKKGEMKGERTLIIKVPLASLATSDAEVPFINILAGPSRVVSLQAAKILRDGDEKFAHEVVKREIIYNLYSFLSFTTKSSTQAVTRTEFAGLVAERLQESSLQALLNSQGSSLTPTAIQILLDPIALKKLAKNVHRCTVRTALRTAEALKSDGVQGPLLLPAIALMTGHKPPSHEGNASPKLDEELGKVRGDYYRKHCDHHPFTKQMKKAVGLKIREKKKKGAQAKLAAEKKSSPTS